MGDIAMDKKEKLFAYLAGACAVILAVHNIALIIQIEENAIFSSIEYVIEICLLSAAWFLRNKTVVLVAAGLSVISDVYYLIAYFSVFNLLTLLADILFAVIVFSALKNKPQITALWFLPAILRTICSVLDMAKLYGDSLDWYFSFWEVMRYDGKWLIGLFALHAIEVAIYALAGYWLYISSPHYKSIMAKAAPAQNISAEADTVERLKKYKQLLDCGAITEEEFQERKSNLLNH